SDTSRMFVGSAAAMAASASRSLVVSLESCAGVTPGGGESILVRYDVASILSAGPFRGSLARMRSETATTESRSFRALYASARQTPTMLAVGYPLSPLRAAAT